MTLHALKGISDAEAQMLTWQHTSYLSLKFVFNPLFTGTLLENKFLRTEDFSEKQFYRFQNILI